MIDDSLRHYVVLKVHNEVFREYFNLNRAEADSWTTSYIARHVYGSAMKEPPFRTVDRPSADVHAGFGPPKPDLQEVVVALNVFGHDKLSSARVVSDIIAAAAEKQEIFSGSSADLPFAGADHWCGSDAADPIFSNRSAAERLLGVDYLRKQSRMTGKGVNVVIVDQGLDQQLLGRSYGDGWKVGNSLPGSPPPRPGSVRRSHGMMVAHNILQVAPEARLFDLPLIPPRITDIQAFLSSAHAAFVRMQTDIATWKLGKFPGSWILVNAWSIYDRASEHPPGNYTESPGNPFNKRVVDLIGDKIDVIFAAGNCGQFCPDGRCGALDQGPGRSIWGANSLDAVLTVGAVRADTMWLGYSSQGPGQPKLGSNKPDFCAASQFREDDDAFNVNSGTSAACGMTGGIVAALRSRWDSATVSPHDLKRILNQTARKAPGLNWGNDLGYRLGNGILDAKAAFQALDAQFP